MLLIAPAFQKPATSFLFISNLPYKKLPTRAFPQRGGGLTKAVQDFCQQGQLFFVSSSIFIDFHYTKSFFVLFRLNVQRQSKLSCKQGQKTKYTQRPKVLLQAKWIEMSTFYIMNNFEVSSTISFMHVLKQNTHK